jgi:hypothetical protein
MQWKSGLSLTFFPPACQCERVPEQVVKRAQNGIQIQTKVPGGMFADPVHPTDTESQRTQCALLGVRKESKMSLV